MTTNGSSMVLSSLTWLLLIYLLLSSIKGVEVAVVVSSGESGLLVMSLRTSTFFSPG